MKEKYGSSGVELYVQENGDCVDHLLLHCDIICEWQSLALFGVFWIMPKSGWFVFMLEWAVWKASKCKYLECDTFVHNVDYLEGTPFFFLDK